MTRNAQSQNMSAPGAERLADGAQAIRAVGVTVQEKHGKAGLSTGPFKTPVPVGWPLRGVRLASRAEPIEQGPLVGRNSLDDLLVQLLEQGVLECQVTAPVCHLRAGGEFSVEQRLMPDAERRAV